MENVKGKKNSIPILGVSDLEKNPKPLFPVLFWPIIYSFQGLFCDFDHFENFAKFYITRRKLKNENFEKLTPASNKVGHLL